MNRIGSILPQTYVSKSLESISVFRRFAVDGWLVGGDIAIGVVCVSAATFPAAFDSSTTFGVALSFWLGSPM